jgi:hypothetical protein
MHRRHHFSATTEFPELGPQSDLFTTVAPAPDGIAWLGSTQESSG